MKKAIIILIIACSGFSLKAQILHPVKWSYSTMKVSKTEAIVLLKVSIADGCHSYSAYQKRSPTPTSFNFLASKEFELSGRIIEPKPVIKREDIFGMDVSYFEHEVIFQQKIKLKAWLAFVIGSLNFMVCNDQKCLFLETINFNIPVK